MTNVEKLKEAQRLLREVAADLDGNQTLCPCCNLRVKANWPQYLIKDTLKSKAKGLDRLILSASDGRLERGWKWLGQPQPPESE